MAAAGQLSNLGLAPSEPTRDQNQTEAKDLSRKKPRKISTDSAESELEEEMRDEQEEYERNSHESDEEDEMESRNSSEDEASSVQSEKMSESGSNSSAEMNSESEDEDLSKTMRRKNSELVKPTESERTKSEVRSNIKRSFASKKPGSAKRKYGATFIKGQNGVQTQSRRCRNSSTKSLNENEQNMMRVSTRSKNNEPVQCLGPGCTYSAVTNSKYCSTDCGMKLAKNRLITFLKSRVISYNEKPALAHQINKSELAKIDAEIEALRTKLVELEYKHSELDEEIEKAKYRQINPNVQRERDRNLESSEVEVFCVTCGNLFTERVALKHMDKCFNKVCLKRGPVVWLKCVFYLVAKCFLSLSLRSRAKRSSALTSRATWTDSRYSATFTTPKPKCTARGSK